MCNKKKVIFQDNKPYDIIYDNIINSDIIYTTNIHIYIDKSTLNMFKDGTSLHDNRTFNNKYINNKYLFILNIISELSYLILDKHIELYLFDDKGVYNIKSSNNMEDIINSYRSSNIEPQSSGTFVHILTNILEKVKQTKVYTITIILTPEGIQRDVADNVKQIWALSHFPVSIIVVGINEGRNIKKTKSRGCFPSSIIEEDKYIFDTLVGIDNMIINKIHANKKVIRYHKKTWRMFDNLNFIHFEHIIPRYIISKRVKEELFKSMFYELVPQYEIIIGTDIIKNKIESQIYQDYNDIKKNAVTPRAADMVSPRMSRAVSSIF